MTFLILIGLVMGILFCTFIPYGAGFDEEQHLVRIFDISGLHLIPNRSVSQGNRTYLDFFTLAFDRQYFEYPDYDEFAPENFLIKPSLQNMVSGMTDSTYLPALFFPQAFIAGLAWRVFNFPILPIVIVMRLLGLLIYLFACCLTMRLLPVGKWVFLVLALSPAALFQASTLNGDGFTNAVSFLFVGLILKLLSQKDQAISQADSWKIFAASLLLGVAKPFTISLLPLLLVLINKKTESKKVVITIISGILLAMIVSNGWVALVNINARINDTKNITNNTYLSQLILVLNNLVDFIPMYIKGIFLSLSNYYHLWVGTYDYTIKNVPGQVYWLFPFALLFAYLAEFKRASYKAKDRLFMILVSLFCLGVIASYMFVIYYKPGQQYISGQGRYFLPFTPLFFLALAGLFELKKWIRTAAAILTVSMIVATIGFYSFGFYRTFYPNCTFAMVANQPCRLPNYKNLELQNPPVIVLNSQTKIEQSFKPHCGSISDIEVRIWSIDANMDGDLQLSLFNDSNQLIRTSEIPVTQIKPGDQIVSTFNFSASQVALKFPDYQVNLDNTYRFELELLNPSSSDTSLAVMARQGDYYTDGELLVNGAATTNADDLYFQYTCAPE